MQQHNAKQNPLPSGMGSIKIGVLLLACLACVVSLVPVVVGAEEIDPLTTMPNTVYVDVPEGSGVVYRTLDVLNNRAEGVTVHLEWDYYADLYPDKPRAPKEWFTSLSPNDILVPSGQQMSFLITVTVPAGVAQLDYRAFIKVSDDQGFAKHDVVVLRVGEAVPTYSFSITNGLFDAVLDEPGAAQAVLPDFGIHNDGTAECLYRVFGKLPSDTSDPEYELAPYTGEGEDVTYDWLTIDADLNEKGNQDTLRIPAYSYGYIGVTLTIPDNVPNGKYKMWVAVKTAQETGTFINKGYSAKLRIIVDRPTTGVDVATHSATPWLLGIVISLVLIIIGRLLWGRVRSRQSRQTAPPVGDRRSGDVGRRGLLEKLKLQ